MLSALRTILWYVLVSSFMTAFVGTQHSTPSRRVGRSIDSNTTVFRINSNAQLKWPPLHKTQLKRIFFFRTQRSQSQGARRQPSYFVLPHHVVKLFYASHFRVTFAFFTQPLHKITTRNHNYTHHRRKGQAGNEKK